jgi:hypothetical protein
MGRILAIVVMSSPSRSVSKLSTTFRTDFAMSRL